MSKKVQTRIRIKYKFDPFVEDQREYEFRIKNAIKEVIKPMTETNLRGILEC